MGYDPDMNLEEIEQKTLAYLKQVSNPLVRIDVLFEHLQRELELGSFSKAELVDFLEDHDLFRVLDPVVSDDESGRLMRDAGFLTEPSVILDTRMPSRAELAVTMLDQLDRLGEALVSALHEARDQGNAETEQQARTALERASKLRERVVKFHAGEAGGPSRDGVIDRDKD